MTIPNIKPLKGVADARYRLEAINRDLRDFNEQSDPIDRTPEKWAEFQNLQAQQTFILEFLKRQETRQQAPKRRRTVWEKTKPRREDEYE